MAGPCANPNCSCSPCLCGDECKCGGGTRLGELEQQVMEVLWASYGSERTGRQVADALPGYAYTTVGTVLSRLSRKGAVRRRVDGRTAWFAAVDTRTERAAAAMRRLLDDGDAGDPDAVLGEFVQSMAPHDAAVLRAALGQRASAQAQRA